MSSSDVRREDHRLVAGHGLYASDTPRDDALHAAFVRSPYASALIAGIDSAVAMSMPGVAAVLTAAELKADGVADVVVPLGLTRPDGTKFDASPRPFLASDRVRFVGEPVVLVIAATPEQATDAVEAVSVDYREQAVI